MSEDFGYGVFDLDEIKKKLLKSGNVIDVIYYMRHYRHLSIEFWNFFIYKMKFDGNDLYKIMKDLGNR
ncbi:hypothetical protein EOM09_03880 [bacterium]|nr:hypothetical protein [bacterium]